MALLDYIKHWNGLLCKWQKKPKSQLVKSPPTAIRSFQLSQPQVGSFHWIRQSIPSLESPLGSQVLQKSNRSAGFEF